MIQRLYYLREGNSSVDRDIVDGVFYCAKYAGTVFKKQGFGNLIITSSISAHIVNVPVDQPVRLNSTFSLLTPQTDQRDPGIQRDKSSNIPYG